MGVLGRLSRKKVPKSEELRQKRNGSPGGSTGSCSSRSEEACNTMSLADLETAVNFSLRQLGGEDDLPALKELFVLSSVEDTAATSRRHDMICVAEGRLISCLLHYVETKSGVQLQTTLLVLSNLASSYENKRPIAIQGAATLTQLLRRDPSCHLAAIVLMHLSFSDAELRHELVTNFELQYVESLALALYVCSMDEQEYLSKGQALLSHSPREALFDVLAKNESSVSPSPINTPMIYPETVQWAMCALKNLSRPSKYDATTNTILKCGILPHILRFVALDSDSKWDAARDSALYIVVHLAAMPSARQQLRECVPPALSFLTQTGSTERDGSAEAIFQRVKARMALAYLCGSEGHYGQPISRKVRDEAEPDASTHSAGSTSAVATQTHSHLLIDDTEATHIVQLFSNMLYSRGKDGEGGYSVATFGVKYVLFAIRCLMTHTHNQTCMANSQGLALNTLLMKVLALHIWQPDSIYIDPEAAEHASFSLYLMSNHGFKAPFLPLSCGSDEDLRKSLAAKILHSYVEMPQVRPAGRHAAQQLLLRLRYQKIEGSSRDIVSKCGWSPVPPASDFMFEDSILEAAKPVVIQELKFGASPRKDIFDRPILRSRVNKSGSQTPFGNTDQFPSALLAAQEFSFGSTRVRHAGTIDVVQIANNVANSANGEKTQSYNCIWSWKDTAGRIQKNLNRQTSNDSFLSFSSQPEKPKKSIFDLRRHFDRLCGSDTSIIGSDGSISEDGPIAEEVPIAVGNDA